LRKSARGRRRIPDNGTTWRFTTGSLLVHTHLKGRIFTAEGVSYLVLSDHCDRPEWLRVKAVNARREVYDMRCEDIERYLAHAEPPRS
jgi:hypothetical protein